MRLGNCLFVVRVPSVGTSDLSIIAAPFELEMLAIVMSWLCGTLMLSGPIARSRSAATWTRLRSNIRDLVICLCTCVSIRLDRNGVT